MSKPKWKKGRQIISVADFEQTACMYYKVLYGPNYKEKTVHRGWIGSWHYWTLKDFIMGGRVYTAEFITGKDVPTKPEKTRWGNLCAECFRPVYKYDTACKWCKRRLDWTKEGEKK